VIVKQVASEIVAIKQEDDVTLTDIEDVISGSSQTADEIIAMRMVDEIVIIRPAADALTIID